MAAVCGTIRSLNLVVFMGSVRINRLGTPLLNLVVKQLKARGHNVTTLDAKEEKFPLLEKPYHHYKGGDDKAPAWLEKWAQILGAADAYILVDCEYNHSPSPGMLNLLDHFWRATYGHKPTFICTYSGQSTGGARTAYILRNTCGELGMITIPTLFHLPAVYSAFNEQGELTAPRLLAQLETAFNELEWYAEMLKKARATGLPVKVRSD
ncbi:unnamed protein product [Didymodactylos carnosus]|uniref:NADPH-dependent FMN reductase-like domain-containing protein n=1 Tax=Didymodactylos carnosus TaxID=1234261 RepID=A0A8S2D8S3_9BILA|nr:unnamed protein product [Didymodactylos carnosus]CAF3625270.1 unnamed protein product [Didymodactylos carnosus]